MAKRTKKNQFHITIMTNDRNEIKANLMKQLYDAVKFGRLAYVDAADPNTQEVVPMLAIVGDMTDGKFDINNVFPIAYFISSEEESLSYLIPDGAGQYVSRRKADPELGVFDGLGEVIEAREEDGKAEEGSTEA